MVLQHLSIFLEIIHCRNGIRGYINDKENIVIKNQHIKKVLEECCGDSVQFCESEYKNESSIVSSSKITVRHYQHCQIYGKHEKCRQRQQGSFTESRLWLTRQIFWRRRTKTFMDHNKNVWWVISFFSALFNIKTTLLKLEII